MSERSERAIKIATQIGNEIVKRFPKHTVYVRHTETGDSGFVEVALRPDGGGYTQEITTAYTEEFFAGANKDNLNERAKRVFGDFKAHFGIK